MNNRSVRRLQSLREGLEKMARGKKSSTLGRNEFTFSGRKHQVAIPETNLYVLKNDHRGQKRIKIQACWSSFRIFHSYNAIIDPTIDCLALVKKSIAAKAAKYQVADIIQSHRCGSRRGGGVMDPRFLRRADRTPGCPGKNFDRDRTRAGA